MTPCKPRFFSRAQRIRSAAGESLRKSIAGAKLIKLESISRNNAIVAYEATIRKGGKTSEIKVAPDGKPFMEK